MYHFFSLARFLNTVHGAGSEIIRGMPGNGDPPGLVRVFVLPVTPFGCDKKPSIFFNNFDDFPNFLDESPMMY